MDIKIDVKAPQISNGNQKLKDSLKNLLQLSKARMATDIVPEKPAQANGVNAENVCGCGGWVICNCYNQPCSQVCFCHS